MGRINTNAQAAGFAATLCAGSLLAHQVAANATRDAMFLSSYDVTDLPRIVVVSAVFSVIVVLATSRLLVRFSPVRFVPIAFLTSSAFLLVEWGIAQQASDVAAVVFYLHTIAFGSVLTSGFWSLVNERFDPRSAKRLIGRIASGGTLGAIVGGVCAERIGATASLDSMFFFLAFLHVFCAFAVRGIGGSIAPKVKPKRAGPPPSGIAYLMGSRYLQSIAALVLLVTVSASLLDYVLKANAAEAYTSGESLMRFFATFYAGLGLVSFVIQSVVSGPAIERLGLGRTAAILPTSVLGASVLALFAPGLLTVGIARAADRVARTSLYRSAYELLYTPISPQKKRATKSIIDVLFDRLGDAVGGGVVSLVLTFAAIQAERVLLGIVAVLCVAGIFVAVRLQRGYVRSLEQSLVSLREAVPVASVGAATAAIDRVVQRTEHLIFDRDQGTFLPNQPEHLLAGVGLSLELKPSTLSAWSEHRAPVVDEQAQREIDLGSRDVLKVVRALSPAPLPPALVPKAIELLAWDEVFREVLRALSSSVDRDVEVLAAALGDPAEEFAVRRRVARVLARGTTSAVADALLQGLVDRRFEVRFQVGRALAKVAAHDTIELNHQDLIAAVRREAGLGRDVWESQRLLDERDDEERDLAARVLADRASRSMEHVFRLLSLVLPSTPLEVAFQGLHTDDATLKGTALEYLDSVLPPDLRDEIWPFLDADAQWAPTVKRSADEVVDSLMKSRPSIITKLASLKSD